MNNVDRSVPTQHDSFYAIVVNQSIVHRPTSNQEVQCYRLYFLCDRILVPGTVLYYSFGIYGTNWYRITWYGQQNSNNIIIINNKCEFFLAVDKNGHSGLAQPSQVPVVFFERRRSR